MLFYLSDSPMRAFGILHIFEDNPSACNFCLKSAYVSRQVRYNVTLVCFNTLSLFSRTGLLINNADSSK